MTDKIMMDGEPLEVGDEVWCFINGKLVFRGDNYDAEFPLEFTRSGRGIRFLYRRDFKFASHYNRTLFWQEFNGPPPPKPKKKVKVWDWVSYCPNGFPLIIHRAMTEQHAVESGLDVRKIDGTEREVER